MGKFSDLMQSENQYAQQLLGFDEEEEFDGEQSSDQRSSTMKVINTEPNFADFGSPDVEEEVEPEVVEEENDEGGFVSPEPTKKRFLKSSKPKPPVDDLARDETQKVELNPEDGSGINTEVNEIAFINNHIETIEEDYEGELLTSEQITNTQGQKTGDASSAKRRYTVESTPKQWQVVKEVMPEDLQHEKEQMLDIKKAMTHEVKRRAIYDEIDL